MANLIRGVLANARNRVSRLLVPLSQQPSSPKPIPRQQHQDEEIFEQDGFYHPVSLGDTFDSGRYSILRKLGYGRYSTVWLARDLKCQRYVALKLLTNNCYGGPYEIFEREILEKIRDVSRKRVLMKGPNGDHVGLTFDVLGHDLYTESMRYTYGRAPVKAVKEIVRQLLNALDFLHTECGVIHTDLKGTNILFELETPNDFIPKYLESAHPRFRTTEGQDDASIPLRERMITEATPHVSEMARLHVRLIDFRVGKFLRIPKLSLASLKRVLNGDIMPLMKPPDMPDDEIDVFIDFVRGMLQIDPMARKSAAQLLQHEWLS
ncbi:hypothetical protein E4U38_007477 [Claviceps purpurea]|nr:hypothetical protein E4U38_007477 [Claviceps purpurea]